MPVETGFAPPAGSPADAISMVKREGFSIAQRQDFVDNITISNAIDSGRIETSPRAPAPIMPQSHIPHEQS
jgi:hypothetical protein